MDFGKLFLKVLVFFVGSSFLPSIRDQNEHLHLVVAKCEHGEILPNHSFYLASKTSVQVRLHIVMFLFDESKLCVISATDVLTRYLSDESLELNDSRCS